jgi:hypothetical protein
LKKQRSGTSNRLVLSVAVVFAGFVVFVIRFVPVHGQDFSGTGIHLHIHDSLVGSHHLDTVGFSALFGKTVIAFPAPFDTKITVNHEGSMKLVVFAAKKLTSSRFLHLSRVL